MGVPEPVDAVEAGTHRGAGPRIRERALARVNDRELGGRVTGRAVVSTVLLWISVDRLTLAMTTNQTTAASSFLPQTTIKTHAIKAQQADAQNLLFDHDGRVIATVGLSALPPWEVTPSSKFPGKKDWPLQTMFSML